MVGHKKVDKWCGHAGNICFTEKLPDHLFNNMMRMILMNDGVPEDRKLFKMRKKGGGRIHGSLALVLSVRIYIPPSPPILA